MFFFLHNFPTLGRGGANEWQNRAIATSPFPRQSWSSPPLRSIKEGGRCTQDSLLVSSCDANHSNIYRVGTVNIWTSEDQFGPLYVFWILLLVLRGQNMRLKILMLMMMTLIMTMGTTRKSVGFVPGWRGWRRGNRARSARPTDQGEDEDHDNL